MKKYRQDKLKAISHSFTWSDIFVFVSFILPPLILYFIELTNTVLILYLGGITSVSIIANLLITKTPIGALGINYKTKAIAILTIWESSINGACLNFDLQIG